MANYIDTKLNIYESWDNGYITESEKFELLEILEASNDDEDSDEDTKKKKKAKKILKNIGITLGIITLILSLPTLYIAAQDTARKVRNGADDVKKLKEQKEKLKSIYADLESKMDKDCLSEQDIDEASRSLTSTMKYIDTLKSLILNYDGTPIQKAKAKKILSEIDNVTNAWANPPLL